MVVDMEKQKNAEAVMAALNSKYTKGQKDASPIVAKLSDRPMDIKCISTGSMVLDEKLGGGFAEGKIIELYGAESSGKCLVKETRILTEDGLMTLQDIFENFDEDIENTILEDNVAKVVDISDKDFKVVNENGVLEKVTALTHNGVKEVQQMVLKNGQELFATLNHPVRIVENGVIVWKQMKDIKPGMKVEPYLRDNSFVEVGSDTVSLNIAKLYGYVIAGGYRYTPKDEKNSVVFSYRHRKVVDHLLELLEEFAETYGEDLQNILTVDEYDEDNVMVTDLYVSSDKFNEFFYDYTNVNFGGLDRVDIAKVLPKSLLRGSLRVQQAFLSTFFEGKSVIKDGVVSFDSYSHDVVHDIQLMLLNFGVVSTIDSKNYRFYDFSTDSIDQTDVYTLTLSGDNVKTFVDIVGFVSSVNNVNVLQNVVSDVDTDFFEVVLIDSVGKVPTFDIVLDDTHSFIANGIVNHNTSIALTALGNTQKSGGTALFIDVENAFDPKYAAKLGVDLDNLYVSQPDSAEQTMDIVQDVVESGAFDIVVIDSVAALVPQAELEGSASDATIGLIARIMSKALRKIIKPANHNKTTVIFINQTRDKIGGFSMYGTPQVTTGGKALKFYASQRVEIKKGQKVTGSSAKDIIGNEINFKIVKNKVAPPFGEGKSILTFNKGINVPAEIIEVGVDYGVMDKKGNTYTEVETGERVGVGKPKCIEKLEEDSDMLERLINAIQLSIRDNLYNVNSSDSKDRADDDDIDEEFDDDE